jgi:putative SOS response-associated peptidase YedK
VCGRFSLTQSGEAIAQTFQLLALPNLTPRYNIVPSQQVATIIQPTQREFRWMQWGLIPSWSKDRKIGNKLINARAETLAEKPSFRNAFKRRRCLIIADGFYEWQKLEKCKQPYYIKMQDGKLFAFAGLWENWKSLEGEEITSCTIITTSANSLMEPIHDRMPVILSPEDCDRWLDSSVSDTKLLQNLLTPYNSDEMQAFPVSSTVNSPANDRAECINPL